jgi:hypothetical protein
MAGKSCARLLVIAGFTRIHAAIDMLEEITELLANERRHERASRRPEAVVAAIAGS